MLPLILTLGMQVDHHVLSAKETDDLIASVEIPKDDDA